MTADETREYLDRLRARGIVVTLDGSALDVSGPVLPVDEEQLRAFAPSILRFLRPLPQSVAHSEPPAQPETGPAPLVAPTAVRFETPVLSVEGRIVTESDVRAYFAQLDDDAIHRYRRGEISKAEAYENTREWMSDYLYLWGSFPRTSDY